MSFLFVDRILKLIPGKLICGVKHVTWDDAYLTPCPKGRLAFPASLIGETLGQLAAWNVMAYYDFTLRPVAGIVAAARLLRNVYPGQTILLESVLDSLDESAVQYHSVATVDGEPVFKVDGAIGPLLPMANFIDRDKVLRQFNAVHRPGDWEAWRHTAENANAKTVSQAPSLAKTVVSAYLEFDRVFEREPGVYWEAEKLVSQAAAYFSDHFPNNPVLPMTVLLECIIHLARQFVAKLGLEAAYQISELRKIKMNDFVHPGAIVRSHLKLKRQEKGELVLSCQSFVEEKRVCIVEVVVKTVVL